MINTWGKIVLLPCIPQTPVCRLSNSAKSSIATPHPSISPFLGTCSSLAAILFLHLDHTAWQNLAMLLRNATRYIRLGVKHWVLFSWGPSTKHCFQTGSHDLWEIGDCIGGPLPPLLSSFLLTIVLAPSLLLVFSEVLQSSAMTVSFSWNVFPPFIIHSVFVSFFKASQNITSSITAFSSPFTCRRLFLNMNSHILCGLLGAYHFPHCVIIVCVHDLSLNPDKWLRIQICVS